MRWSVLTPSLNQGSYLHACLQSVAVQTHPVLEHIVCDGGSTDGTLALLQRAPANVRWLSEPDGGQAAALNRAYAMSSGDAIAWLNSDDAFFSTTTLAAVSDIFERVPEADVVMGDAAIVNETGLVLRHHSSRWPGTAIRSGRWPVPQPAVFFRRTIIERLGYFLDEPLVTTMDLDLFIRMARAPCKVVHARRTLAIDRIQPMRKTVVLRTVYESEAAALCEKYGIRLTDTFGDRVTSWWRRLEGLPHAVTWGARYELVPGLRLDSILRRSLRQILVPTRSLISRQPTPG